ncbi:hypothetical protein [Rhizohabitans arisaemae]|uniref:hypothetical protein n=1 Tax=Rhizohabitans arisaemae TaxID=2720610 RepID=UPI0024B1C0C5|nr:hypothetical protein [Rhizohabitans arisaemae]
MQISELDMPIVLIHNQPGLAPNLLKELLGVEIPEFETARIEPTISINFETPMFEGVVVTLWSADESCKAPKLAILVDVQREEDERKRYTWPADMVLVRERLRCPVMLLVLCPDDEIARWCEEPIDVAPRWILRPLVLGPSRIPVVADPEKVKALPELAVLSALAHRDGPAEAEILEVLQETLNDPAEGAEELYVEYVKARLTAIDVAQVLGPPDSGGDKYRTEFASTFYNDGFLDGEATGFVRGEARAVLTVLEARGLDVPKRIRDRIADCDDEGLLDAWLHRAVAVSDAKELFSKH